MAIAVKYFITDVNGNFIDWNQSVSGLSILGKEAQVLGSAGVDVAYVQAGSSANLSSLGGGNDKVYLTGNLAQYTQAIDQDTGIYTFTRTAGLPVGQSEVVKVTVSNENDVLYFADGHITLNAESDARLFDGTSFQSLQSGWLTAGGTPAAGPAERNTPTTASTPARVFITDAGGVDLPGLPQPGQRMVVSGSGGVDAVYVKAGTQVDASSLGGGNDRVYLGGNLADYSQSIDQDTGVYTLTRTVGSLVEVVKVTLSNEDDVLYFANGHIVLNAGTDARLFDGTAFNQLQTAWLTAGGTPGTTATVTTVNVSTAPNLSGQSVISGKALANASVTVTIDPDNNAATSNSFTYAVTADANGDYSLNLATATPASGTPSFVAGTASISVVQAVPGGASPATVITLPVSTTTTYSASIASDHVTEGGNAVFTVTRSGDTSGAGTIVYATQNGSASAPGDYTSASGTLSFAAGQTTKTVTVTTIDDANVEGNETLSLVLSNPTGGNLGTASATATIVDNEGALFSIAGTATGVSFSEGVGTYTFTVNRSGLTTGAATVVVSSGGGTAGSSDYNAVNQTLSFAAGETSKTVTVTINEDALVEGNETFNLQLGSPSAGALVDPANASVTATILDNEAAVLSIDNAAAGMSFSEGVGSATFSLTRSGDTSSAVTVVVQSAGGTAAPGSGGSNDYNAVNQTISFGAGETAKTVTVTINEDVQVEGNETFKLQLSSPSAGALIDASKASITATIQDNEAAVISIDNAATGVVGVDDYTANAGQTLSWGVGEVTKVVTVALTNDTVAEIGETVIGQIATDSGFTAGLSTAASTILDDDGQTLAAGAADTVTTGTASGSYLGGTMLDTGDMNDIVTIGTASNANSVINLGAGDDTLNTGTAALFLINGAQYIGGAGVDTLKLGTNTSAYNFSTTASAGNLVKGFEIIDMTASGNQTINLSLQDVLEFISGNSMAVTFSQADTFRITGNSGDILNLQALGKTLSTLPAGTGNLTDVDGATYNVVASGAGNASANDVVIGAATYDVYQYQHGGHTLNLLVNTLLAATTTVV